MRLQSTVALLLLLLRPGAARAAWAKVPIVDVPERIAGAAVGRLEGVETLAFGHGLGVLLIQWGHEGWNFQEVRPDGLAAATVADLDPKAGGIGAALGVDGRYPTINFLLPGGAAQRDGRLRANDKIEAVAQGEAQFADVRGLPLEQVTTLIRGTPGSRVRLRVLRDEAGAAPFIVELARGGLPRPAAQATIIQSAFGVSAEKRPLAIAIGRSDGVGRLYVGADSGFTELSSQGGVWSAQGVALPGDATDEMQAAKDVDGKIHLFVSRIFSEPTGSRDHTCISNTTDRIYECSWASAWKCEPISEPCSGPFVVNPPGKRDYDVLLGRFRVLTRKKGEGWKNQGSFYGFRYIVPSTQMADAVYADAQLVRFSDDFSKQSHETLGSPNEDMISVTAAQVAPDSEERVFLGGSDWHVYESTGAPYRSLEDMGKARGVPWNLLPADLRRTGFDHLYVSEERGNTYRGLGTTISEYTYYESTTRVAVLGFDVSSPADRSGPSDIAGSILGDLLRSELLTFGHLDLVETENIDKVLAERQFQASQCSGASCLAEIGRLLKAQASVKGFVKAQGGHFLIGVEVIDTHRGRVILNPVKRVDRETAIPDAIRDLARTCALDWPHSFGSTGATVGERSPQKRR